MGLSLLTDKFTNRSIKERVNYLLKHQDLEHKKRIRTVTAAYTVTLEDHTILVDATSGAVTVTLPKAYNGDGYIFHIKKIDSSANAVTIDGDGSETIDDSTTYIISSQYSAITLQSDGSEWWIL